LEAFRQFIEAYPVMKDFTAQQFGDYSITGASASLNVELRKDSRKTLMVFNLDRSGGEWKIQGIKHVQQTEEQGKVTELDSSKLSAVVRGQLQAIKQGEIPRAYYDFTSSQFRQGTTLDQFTAFVHANPVLSFNESIAFDELKYTHDVATFICTLRAAGGATTKVDYEMVMEGGFWKISKIHLEGGQAQKGAARMKPVAFDKAVFGTQVGEGGKILDPSQVLKARQSDIYVNLYLKGGTKGDIIQVQFEYLDNATKIPKVAYTLPQDGDQWITFNFSAPADGWPTGNYQLTMTSLSGTDKVFPFTIE
jgi:hypothetical protein